MRYPLATVLVLILGSCLLGSSTAANPGVTMSVGETAETAGLKLTFRGVKSDNRCPKNARCIVEGQASVLLDVETDGEKHALRIDVPPGRAGHGEFEGRKIAVTVEPQPTAGEKIDADAYVLTVTVGS